MLCDSQKKDILKQKAIHDQREERAQADKSPEVIKEPHQLGHREKLFKKLAVSSQVNNMKLNIQREEDSEEFSHQEISAERPIKNIISMEEARYI